MNKNIEDFIKLVRENPELPVMCMTDSEICYGAEYDRYAAQIGYCYIANLICYNEQIYFNKEDFMEDYYCRNDEELDNRFGYDCNSNTEENKEHERALDKYLEDFANEHFKSYIIVNIDLPEDSIMNFVN